MTLEAHPDPHQILDQAKELLNHGKLQESLAAFNKLIDLGMQAEGFYGSGLVKLALGDIDEAEIELTRSLNLDPKNASHRSE